MAKTPRKFPTEDGWGIAIYKYRAYFSHPGVPTDPEIPEWLKASIARQSLWNRLAYFCREARRKCSPAPTAEIVAFVRETILPEIDAFNDSLGRSKAKIKHPAKLKTEMPGPDGLWNFVGQLRTRIEKGRAVPEGLLEKIIVFAEQFKPDYTPLNEFLNNYHNIAAKEATDLGLLRYEIRPTVSGFKAVLDRRKTTKAAWSEGWPLIKYPDSPKAANWGVHYYFNTAGLDSAQIESPKGVPGLTLGPHLKPSDTGHELLTGLAATKRSLRAAEISISGPNHEQCTFRFGVLYHRPLPAGSHLKEWKLIYADGALWLCLTVELQHPVPVHSPLAAGLDVGWRRTEEGLRFGTLYEPATMSFRELSIDMQKSPKDYKDRMPFRIDIGPTRWEKRNILQLLPDWKPGNPIPSSFETRTAMQSRRDYYKDTAKILLRKHLGESMPAWIDKAGRRGLLKLVEEFKEDEVVQNILGTWKQQDEQVGKLVSMYLARSTKRLEYGQAQVAHDVCRYLHDKGVHRLIVETSFLAKVSQRHDNEDSEGLKRSRSTASLRQWASSLQCLQKQPSNTASWSKSYQQSTQLASANTATTLTLVPRKSTSPARNASGRSNKTTMPRSISRASAVIQNWQRWPPLLAESLPMPCSDLKRACIAWEIRQIVFTHNKEDGEYQGPYRSNQILCGEGSRKPFRRSLRSNKLQ